MITTVSQHQATTVQLSECGLKRGHWAGDVDGKPLEGEKKHLFFNKIVKNGEGFKKMYGVNECMDFFDKKLWAV